MLVISRNTAFTYRDKRVDTKQIGRELCVRYVLEGSVRRSGNRVRINTQLIDAETHAHLWAERFDGDTGDLFALQDEVTSRIANALGVEMIVAEAARPTEHPDALDYILRGRAVRAKGPARENYAEAISLFERALALDPQSVEAQSWLARVLVSRQMDFGSDQPKADIAQAQTLSLRALAAAPRNPLAHFARAQVLRVQGRLDEAISEYETVLASNDNWVEAFAAIGRCKIFIGPIEDGIAAQQQAIRLSPRDPMIGLWYFRIGQAHLLQLRIEEAILWLVKARRVNPEIPFFHAYLASAYALHGDAEQAAAQLTEAQRLDGVGNYSSIARQRRRQAVTQNRGARPEIRALFETTYFAGLRKAGMPEE
jgi:tetratricopeptide (TPR) repeat protein